MKDIKILILLPELPSWADYILALELIYPNKIFVHKLENEQFINKYCDQNNIDFILPTRCEQYEYLLNHNINRKYFCPNNYESIDILNNKAKFLQYFIDNYLTHYIPQTYIIKTDIINYKQDIIYPCIYKPCIGSLGSNIKIIKNSVDLNFDLGNNYIIQGYIQNKNEYVGNFIVNNGKVLYSIILKEIFNDEEFYYKNYSAKNYDIIDVTPNVIETFNTIFTKLNYTGMACADYKIINDEVIIFEINPRFGATIIKTNLLYKMLDKLIELNPLNV